MLERVRAAGAHLRSLADPIDTASPTGRLALQVIGAIAEFERNLIAERTRAGLAVARSRGRRLGNPALRAGEPETVCRLVTGQRRARLEALNRSLDDWLSVVRRLRPGASWERVAAAVNAALPAGRPSPASGWRARCGCSPRRGWPEAALLAPARGAGRDVGLERRQLARPRRTCPVPPPSGSRR